MTVDDLVRAVVSLLKENQQLELLPQVAEALTQVSFTQADPDLATVTTALALSVPQKQALSQTLSKIFRRRIRVKQKIDREVIGGMRIDLNGRVIDTSLNQQLNDLHEVLIYD